MNLDQAKISACESPHLTLEDVIDHLENLGEKLQFGDFQALISLLNLDKPFLASQVSFHADHYTRMLVYESNKVSVLLLGWLPNQKSPIHSHNGSLCATLIVQGILTNRQFRLVDNGLEGKQLYLQLEEQLSEGTIGFLDRDGIHQAVNTSQESLITLHIYSPRLQSMKFVENRH